jgi:hypothetical protein
MKKKEGDDEIEDIINELIDKVVNNQSILRKSNSTLNKSVSFSQVDVYLFNRSQGFTSIPSEDIDSIINIESSNKKAIKNEKVKNVLKLSSQKRWSHHNWHGKEALQFRALSIN